MKWIGHTIHKLQKTQRNTVVPFVMMQSMASYSLKLYCCMQYEVLHRLALS